MFNINGETWRLKFTQPFDDVFLMPNGEYTVGVCDDNEKTIFLSTSLGCDRLRHVLCHEIVHAAMFSYNVFLDYQQEELLANIIATFGGEIIKITDNMFKGLPTCGGV